MCRYSDADYKTHFACLRCEHTAKFPKSSAPRCPRCREVMIDLGRDFKAPRKEAKGQWEKIRLLVAQGIRFDSCGCEGPGDRPRTLGDARREIVEAKRSR